MNQLDQKRPPTFADFGIKLPNSYGFEVLLTCPQCSPGRKKKTAKCLCVNTVKNCWWCAHCDWRGGLFEPTSKSDPSWHKPQWRKPTLFPVEQKSAFHQFFESRGIPKSVVERNGIFQANVYMPQLEEEADCVAFAYRRQGEPVNVKYRDFDKNFRMESGAERILYGLDDIDPERCVIVEGEMDKLAVEVAGIRSCVSVPDGAPAVGAKNYSTKFTFLDADAETLEGVKEWIIAVDADEPGQKLSDELIRRLGRDKCKVVSWPSDCKDANDALLHCGAEGLRVAIDAAKPLPIEGVFSVNDFAAKIYQLYEKGWERGVKTGWHGLDEFYTVRPGEFTVITGIPNAGKSNFLDALITNLSTLHGWSFGIFSPENQPLEDHMSRMFEKFTGLPFGEGPTKRMDESLVDQAMTWAADKMFWILPDDDSDWTIETVLERAKALVLRKGIRGLVIDPWNELEHDFDKKSTETAYIGTALKRIRQFARRHQVHVFVVAHPAKLYRDRESGGYPVPTLYDISGSANWRNKADNGLVVWRDYGRPDSPVEIHVQKVRFRQVGKIGMTQFTYDPVTATYAEVGGFGPKTNVKRWSTAK